jgi:hypothetical protein
LTTQNREAKIALRALPCPVRDRKAARACIITYPNWKKE